MTFKAFIQKFFFKKCRDGRCASRYAGLSAREIQHLFWDCVCQGNVEEARELVACGADVNAFDVDGHSALYMASLHGRHEMYMWLNYMREREAKRLENQHMQAA